MPRDSDSRNALSAPQTQRDLFALAELSGLQADPAVFRIIIELLSMQINPDAIYKLLKYIRRSSRAGKQPGSGTSKKNG